MSDRPAQDAAHPPLGRELREDTLGLLREAAAALRRHRWAFLAGAAAIVAATCALWPHDPSISRSFTTGRPPFWEDFAGGVRRWGAFTDTLVFCAAVYLAGLWRGRRAWRTAALAAFLAASMAGLPANAVRLTTGRPRPRANEADVFHGPTLVYKYQSFPSGHASASVGSAAALLSALPAAGLPALLSAGAVVWSSMYSRNHYATDVLVGSGVGALYGIAFGLGARRLRRGPGPPTPKEST